MRKSISAFAITSKIFEAGDDLFKFIIDTLSRENLGKSELEGQVLAVTSKIVSLAERRLLHANGVSKETLVRAESDQFLGEIGFGCFLTIKHGLFIASAGIDESNSRDGAFILYPEQPFQSARALQKMIKDFYQLKEFGILITDSHTSPLRAGVSGVTLAHAGFRAIDDRVGQVDLFGRKLVMTKINVADALSGAAVYCMGESSECTPLALVSSQLKFIEAHEENENETFIDPSYDLYYPLYKNLL